MLNFKPIDLRHWAYINQLTKYIKQPHKQYLFTRNLSILGLYYHTLNIWISGDIAFIVNDLRTELDLSDTHELIWSERVW